MNTTTTTRTECPACGRDIAVRANGALYTHGPRANRCPATVQTTDTDQELLDALDRTDAFVKLDDMGQLAQMWDIDPDTTDDDEDTHGVPQTGYIACQDDDTHGWHVAEYSHQSQHGDRPIYTTVCSGYTEYYDITMVHDTPQGPVTEMFA